MQGTRVWFLIEEDPHAMEQLRLCATTTELRAPQQEKPLQWEACAAVESSRHLPQLEKACSQQRRPRAANK